MIMNAAQATARLAAILAADADGVRQLYLDAQGLGAVDIEAEDLIDPPADYGRAALVEDLLDEVCEDAEAIAAVYRVLVGDPAGLDADAMLDTLEGVAEHPIQRRTA